MERILGARPELHQHADSVALAVGRQHLAGEVLSANEEFQSTNEELETSKEELQSANEELITTKDELRNRNRELVKGHGC